MILPELDLFDAESIEHVFNILIEEVEVGFVSFLWWIPNITAQALHESAGKQGRVEAHPSRDAPPLRGE
jgi:hypothetical protein